MRYTAITKNAVRILRPSADGANGTNIWINTSGHTSAQSLAVKSFKASPIRGDFYVTSAKCTRRTALPKQRSFVLIPTAIDTLVKVLLARRISMNTFADAMWLNPVPLGRSLLP
jgi:hypothetical protein